MTEVIFKSEVKHSCCGQKYFCKFILKVVLLKIFLGKKSPTQNQKETQNQNTLKTPWSPTFCTERKQSVNQNYKKAQLAMKRFWYPKQAEKEK